MVCETRAGAFPSHFNQHKKEWSSQLALDGPFFGFCPLPVLFSCLELETQSHADASRLAVNQLIMFTTAFDKE